MHEDRRKSFDVAFRAEFPRMHRYLARRVGHDAATDIAAETFATAFASWNRFDRSRELRPWLYGIAANLLRRHHRDEERQLRAFARTGAGPVPATPDDGNVLRRLDARAQQCALALALAALRDEERDVLLLHAWAELTNDEIATALALPVGTVKSRLHRARERVRNSLAANGEYELTATTEGT